ncbi:hypothetical protein CAOG_08831, partial [Capsaspora owczarzaki ATCC 30864]|uniref:hypothetical protein n=1 Tax=Capsaspora owczarzaki (strain ATCC 30864) TaxID=595528 RepID=UPI0003523762
MSTAKVSIPDLATTAATATVTTTTAAASVAAVAAAESPAAHGLSGVVPIAQGGVSRVPHHWSRGASSMSLVASLSHDPPALHTHSHSHPHSGTQSNSGTQSLSLSSSSSSSSSGSTTAPLLLHDHNGASQFEQAFATTHAPFCMNESADKSVFIIYTGGTIGMKKQTNGSLSVEP